MIEDLVAATGAERSGVATFEIPGEPVPKARPRARGRGVYTPDSTTAAELAICLRTRAAKPGRRAANVALAAVFYRSTRRVVDVDNLLKTLLDGITKAGCVWRDDTQVTALIGVIELDRSSPRTVVAIGDHRSTLTRGA